MTPERWQRVEEVLQAALDRPEQDRAAFLIEACFGDDELQHETSSLIDAYDESGDFIEVPAISQDAHVLINSHEQTNIGREIGPYKIIERLGGGGMGEVYLAEDRRLDRLVALKILPSYFVSDDARLRRFQREARAASALNHPNILTIHEVGESGDVHFITTEFIDGQTIRELISRDDLSLTEVLEIGEQVAEALAAAHAAGIVHRDIKPENIMRRRDGIAKILDFGIAKLLEQPDDVSAGTAAISKTQTEIGVVLGTAGYMSPEQARALQVDERTDIWSLGVVLYEMLSGRPPFRGATRMDTMVAILERDPAPLFQTIDNPQPIFGELQSLISKALRKDADERYQTATEMLAALRSIRQQAEKSGAEVRPAAFPSLREVRSADETPTAIRAETVKPTFGKMRSRRAHPFVLYGLIAVVLIGLAVGGLLYRRSRQAAIITPVQKLYSQMSPAEQLAFVDEQEQRISAMMGERPVKLNDEALQTIKRYVDRYAARQNSVSVKPGQERLSVVYERGAPYVPLIANAFAARRIPIIVGIYLPMIESEYKPCAESSLGARGLFQFLPQTAEHYGVARADMCDVQKMTPAAAHYIADSMAELGDDSQSMTLVLLSYNRGSNAVRDALRLLRETDANYERNFWTLFANRDKLDESFRRESAGYVPIFFAAAIVGENPRTFELSTPPLSSLATGNTGKKL